MMRIGRLVVINVDEDDVPLCARDDVILTVTLFLVVMLIFDLRPEWCDG